MFTTFMETEYATITVHLVAALIAGGMIGLERSFPDSTGFSGKSLIY